ncbi:DUF4268 domain-containing protein [Faecalibacterium prausnitzii]|uniref:DUF4268 domain-containing protein n=1 Tax=Faecalibacterium prausnitzii TaxID=853 RepID=UPI003DA149A7
MNGNAQKLIKYLDGASKRFIIPVYQRNYDWKMEHCKQLYDDLVKIIRQNRKSHFFGSIVSVQSESGTMEEFLIIDGQQRLTTISLLLLAIYHLLSSGKMVSRDHQLTDKILKKYLIDEYEPEEKRIKLKPIKNDQKAFGILFDQDEEYIPDSNLTINYRYFYGRIQHGELDIDELFDAICKLEIINISLNHEDNPQLIFESLNSTGLNLSEGDKIRNYILMGLPNDQQTKFYEKYWNRIESYTDYDVSSFVRDYLSIKQQSTPNMNSVYPTFKKYVEDAEVADIEPLLKDLLEYAKRYAFLIKGGHSDERLNSCIYRLNRLSTSITRPFLLEVIRLSESGALTADELIEVFHFTESYLFRRAICDLPTNALNKIFLLLHREIIRFDGDESHYVEKFKYALLSKRERTRFPSDEEFAECMSTRNIYGMNPKNKLYLFERLENSETSETKDVWGHLDRGEYSIEHIMPQHLTAAWIVSLGDNYEAIHTNWLHRLANLTLTAYNSRYSNSPFAEKRDMPHGFKDSGLRINQWVGRKEQWGVPELEERDQLLKNTVIGIWSYPTSNYHPQKKQMDAIALDEDVILTGRVLSKYSFKGAEQPVASWADMYQQVITMLHSENKAVLTKLAVSQDPVVDLSLHFSMSPTSFNSCRQIDTDLYVWTGTDTQYKINNLRKIFAIFDVPESELVFYLKDEDSSETVAGNRYEIRKKYWEYTLPQLKNAFSENGLFGNVNPVTSNWIAGFVGIPGIHIDCVANFDESRVELYLGMASKEKNKELFGFLFARKDNIEKVIGTQLIWSRMDDNKASKIHTFLPGVDISKDIDWPRMAKFHVDASKKLYLAFKEHLEQYFHISL